MSGGETASKHVFQDIYITYHERIRRYLTRLVGESDAEDLTQEVFIKVDGALRDFRRESQLSTWIYRIATNTALDRLRSPDFSRANKASHSIADYETDIEDKNVWSDMTNPLPDQQLIRKQMNDCIREVVDGLPDDYRAVLIMSELEGLTNSEIAEVSGISLDTAKIRLHRARKKLREALETKCNFYHDERNELSCDRKPAVPIFFRI
ncbi:MAG: sigma-70 family RNA polymerase sigma factor [Nitrospiraceae bacterium]|nr:sigma-70 family RNA polymerase sigma factor [Nitrospiraceae bacterium]